MKHEDFTTIELDDVLTRTLKFCLDKTEAKAAHWISTYGLARIQDNARSDWQWTLSAADVIGRHMWSIPASDLVSLYNMWNEVNQIYGRPWKAPFQTHMLTKPHPRFIYPVTVGDKLLGMLVIDQPRKADSIELMRTLHEGMTVASRYLQFAYDLLNARNQSYLDEVTGLYNQRYLPMVLEHEIQRSKREKSEFCLLFLDVDYFKMVNDGRGHWVGSKLLIELGKVLKNQVRYCDYTFRYGGDEFIVLLGNASVEDSKKVAERIRKAIEQQSFTVEGHTLNLTVSIGLAGYPQHGQTASSLIQIADQAMYYGKRKSRNIVFVAS